MTLDDLYAAPVVGANRHAFELFGNMRPSTQEEIDAHNKMRADMSIPLNVNINDIVAASERVERQRQLEYDERVVATPMNLTWDDLAENHAAGLPVTREHIVRCKDCHYFLRDASPYEIDDCPHFCSKHGIDMAEDDGFCSWGRCKDE